MFKKILFATDFSDVSRKAMMYVKQLRGAGEQEVIILHVIDEKEWAVLSTKVPDQYLRLMAELEEEIAEEMGTIEREMTGEGFGVKLEVKRGTPFMEIMATAAEEKASVLVIGSHGRSNIKEMLMGSVSENVIRHAKVPLLVINREA